MGFNSGFKGLKGANVFRRNNNFGNLREINSGNHLPSTDEDENNFRDIRWSTELRRTQLIIVGMR